MLELKAWANGHTSESSLQDWPTRQALDSAVKARELKRIHGVNLLAGKLRRDGDDTRVTCIQVLTGAFLWDSEWTSCKAELAVFRASPLVDKGRDHSVPLQCDTDAVHI